MSKHEKLSFYSCNSKQNKNGGKKKIAPLILLKQRWCVLYFFLTSHSVNNTIFSIYLFSKIILERKLFREVVLYDPVLLPTFLVRVNTRGETNSKLHQTPPRKARLFNCCENCFGGLFLFPYLTLPPPFFFVEMICPWVYKVMVYGMGERSKFEMEFKDNLYGMRRFIDNFSDKKR